MKTCLFFFLLVASLSAQTDQARHWLDQAEREYRSGSFERAEFHLRQAIGADQQWVAGQAPARRLQGLVDLAVGKTLSGYNHLQASLRLKDDARLYYMVADHLLSLRNYEGAARAFAKAVESQKGAPLDGAYTHLAFLPLACPVVQGEAWLAARKKNDFADFSRLPLLAEPSLTKEELVLAAYLAASLARVFSRAETARLDAQLERLLGTTRASDFLFPDTYNYIVHRDEVQAHDRCWNRLEGLYKEQASRIALGTTEATVNYLPFLQEKRKLLFWLRAAYAPDAASYYSFSSFLLHQGNTVEALHLARRALLLHKRWPDLPSDSTADLLATMRLLEHIYRDLGQLAASRSTGLFSAELERLRKEARPPGEADRRKLREIARENYDWREGLVFLTAISEGEEKARYQKLLERRDEKSSEKELFSAYQFLY